MKLSNTAVINQVKEIILKHAKPTRIYLYGSQENGEARVGSDIDIAYDDQNFKQNSLIENEVSEIKTLIKIDVKNIAKVEDRFKNRVISTGRVIYSSTKQLRAEDGVYNFSKALSKFVNIVDRQNEFQAEGYADIYLDLVVKRFEFTYEMSWKALKRYIEYIGIEIKNPRMAFKEGFTQGMISNESIWLDMIEQRNLSSHIYDENEIIEILSKLQEYKTAFTELLNNIQSGLNLDKSMLCKSEIQ